MEKDNMISLLSSYPIGYEKGKNEKELAVKVLKRSIGTFIGWQQGHYTNSKEVKMLFIRYALLLSLKEIKNEDG